MNTFQPGNTDHTSAIETCSHQKETSQNGLPPKRVQEKKRCNKERQIHNHHPTIQVFLSSLPHIPIYLSPFPFTAPLPFLASMRATSSSTPLIISACNSL